MKICSKCKLEKDESLFFKRKDGACGYRSHCKACCKLYVCSDSGKLVSQRYNTKPARKLKHRIHGRKYSHSPQGVIARKRYMQSENGRRAARGSFLRRRDRETGLASRLSLKEINQVYTKFNNRCYNCGTSSRLEIDHHKPLSSGYGLTLDNAVILCRACNASKKDKLPEEFYTEQQIATLATILHDDG